MKRFYTLFFVMVTVLFAQDSSYEVYRKTINHMGPNDTEFLMQMVESKDFSTPIKVLAVERVGQLVESGHKSVNPKVGQLYPKLSEAYDAHPEVGLPYNHEKIRRAVCLSLSQFEATDQKQPIIDIIAAKLAKEKVLLVYGSCMQALSTYIKYDPDKIVDVLLKELMTYGFTKEAGYTDENIAKIQSIVTAMGDTNSKKAFVPLLRVLESGLPISVKKTAEVSIDRIEL